MANTTQVGQAQSPALVRVRKTLKHPQFWFGLAVLVPVLSHYAYFGLRPLFRAFWMAAVNYSIMHPEASRFVGLQNFETMLHYDLFWVSVRNTLTYAGLAIVLQIPLSMFVSLCLAKVGRGRRIYQFIVYIPVVVSMLAIGLLFKMLMEPQLGIFNRILRTVGLRPNTFLTHSSTALYSIIGVDVWKGLGYYVILITSGLMGIPEEYYDAAKVDGASSWQRFWRVTLPLLRPTLTFVLVILAIGCLQVYGSVYILPNPAGGPGQSTYVISLLVVSEAFSNGRFGLATAVAFSLFAFILLVTLIQLRLLRVEWAY